MLEQAKIKIIDKNAYPDTVSIYCHPVSKRVSNKVLYVNILKIKL